jgi:hypothetical protein
MDERPRLTASEIEAQLIAELHKLPSLRDTQSVRIRPYSGPKGWTWELDKIEPDVGPTHRPMPKDQRSKSARARTARELRE